MTNARLWHNSCFVNTKGGQMQAVYDAENLIDAYLVRHALEAAGIPVYIRGEALVGGVGELPAYGLVAVCVPPSALTQARDLIAALPLLAGDTRSAAAEETSVDVAGPGCPQAGSAQGA